MGLVRTVLVVALAVVLWGAERASADAIEQLVQLARHPTDPRTFAIRYRYGGEGLVVTHDGGEHFALLCSSAIDPRQARQGTLAIAADGTTFLGVFKGLFQDDGKGCGWHLEPSLNGHWVSDLVHDPIDPDTLCLTTASGGEGVKNGVYRRSTGSGWAPVGTQGAAIITRLHVVRVDGGRRFYQSVLRGTSPADSDGESPQPDYVVRHSDDNGETWTAHAFGPTDGTLRLQGVDPSDPDRLVATLSYLDQGSEVLVSEDRGETWSAWLRLGAFGGLAFAPDGRVWIGDAGNLRAPLSQGLFYAESLVAEPNLLTDAYPVSCLGFVDEGLLLACQRFAAGHVSTADGSFQETFRFDKLERFIQCDGTLASGCERLYCRPSHFPNAPACEPYRELSTPEQLADASAPTPSVPASTGSADGGVPGADASVEGGPSGGSDPAPGAPPSHVSSCRAGGYPGESSGPAWHGMLALVLGGCALRTRARRRAKERRPLA